MKASSSVRRGWASIVAVVIAVAVGSAACTGAQPRSDRADSAIVLARVAGTPVTTGDVGPLLGEEEPVRMGARPRPDPVGDAVETAVLHKLLAKEAERRDLVPASAADQLVGLEAQRIQALLAEERARHGLDADAISEDEAQETYERRRDDFDRIEEVEVTYASFSDERRAESLLEVDGRSQPEFRARVVRAGGKPSTATVDSKGEGTSLAVTRVALALRREGAVGMAQDEDGRFYVVRADAVHFERHQWDLSVSTLVRTALAWERERDHLRRLGDQLARRWPVELDRNRIADFSTRWRERRPAGTDA